MLIDIHTHQERPMADSGFIVLDPRSPLPQEFLPSFYYCLGPHPWFINDIDWPEFNNKRLIFLKNRQCLIWGEIGLDRTRGDFKQQVDIVKNELKWVSKHNIGLIVLHCVKAHDELLALIKKSPYQGKILLHDYNGHPAHTQKWLDLPTYFGLGDKLWRENSQMFRQLDQIPRERIFLETDNQMTHTIADQYLRYAKITGEEIEIITQDMASRFLLLVSNI